MELLNATSMKAGVTTGLRPDGGEALIVAVKGTFDIADGEVATVAEQQADLVLADEFTGEPGLSAPLYEAEFAPFKPRCDVLLNGTAYAPNGRPASRVTVQLEVGAMRKRFDVVGDRLWRKSPFLTVPSDPRPFRTLPISYDLAYGGSDAEHPEPKKARTFLPNHVGRGYHSDQTANGRPLPNTEECGKPIRSHKGEYRPMAFGPVGRAWQPRAKLAGTYDEAWQENVFPFLPADFDDRYHQAAPEDQQIDYPKGGERVELTNLTEGGRTRFRLPSADLPVTFYCRNRDEHEARAVVDAIIIEPDATRLMLVWRASLPLRRNIFEVKQVVVGTMPPSWHRARRTGKRWYRSVGELVRAKPMKPIPRRSDASHELDEAVTP